MLVVQGYSCQSNNFNPRTSYEMRRYEVKESEKATDISIHAPRLRCDSSFVIPLMAACYFNPRTSYEMRHLKDPRFIYDTTISIHAPRMRCDLIKAESEFWKLVISIHAPRMRCDDGVSKETMAELISIHAPRMRCDFTKEFWDRALSHFNPRTSYEMRLQQIANNTIEQIISIHAPRMRCDQTIELWDFSQEIFQSTHLV